VTEPRRGAGINPNEMSSEGVYVDKSFTIVATGIGLLIGMVAAFILGGIILLIRVPLAASAGSGVSLVSLMLPAAAIASIGSLLFGVFQLPVRFAKRRGVILDPEIYPFWGAILIGVLLTLLFVAAIVLRII